MFQPPLSLMRHLQGNTCKGGCVDVTLLCLVSCMHAAIACKTIFANHMYVENEVCSCGCDAGILVYTAFAVLQCTVLRPEPYYGLYDTDNWAKARWFLLKRMAVAAQEPINSMPAPEFGIFNSTAISDSPGGPNRWRLSQDTSGKQEQKV